VLIIGVYIELAKKSFRSSFVYKANTMIFVVTSLFYLAIQVSVWYALIGSGSVEGITFLDMMTLMLVQRIIWSIIRSNVIGAFSEIVRDGSVGDYFTKPISLKLNITSRQIGDNLFHTVFTTIPMCIIAAIFFGFKLPESGMNLFLFIISTIFGMILYMLIDYTLGLLVFWFKNGEFLDWGFHAVFSLFSGAEVPLWFYPELLSKLSYALPFRLVSFTPVEIYLGKITNNEALVAILLQILWIIVFYLTEKFVWIRAQKVVTVQGG
jgi:ABC-2 type transport system permease protein